MFSFLSGEWVLGWWVSLNPQGSIGSVRIGGNTTKTSTHLVFASRIDIAITPLAKWQQSLIVVPNAAGFGCLEYDDPRLGSGQAKISGVRTIDCQERQPWSNGEAIRTAFRRRFQ